jgi:hypothetical protein
VGVNATTIWTTIALSTAMLLLLASALGNG